MKERDQLIQFGLIIVTSLSTLNVDDVQSNPQISPQDRPLMIDMLSELQDLTKIPVAREA
jgi:hypothetical protein